MKSQQPQKSNGRGRPVGSVKGKMSKAQQIKFLRESQKVILNEHFSHKDYTEWCKDKHKLSAQSANNYWIEVWDTIRDKYQQETDKLVSKHVHKYWELYDKSIDRKDYNTARQILNDIAKLIGFDNPTKIEVTGEQTITFKFGDEDID